MKKLCLVPFLFIFLIGAVYGQAVQQYMDFEGKLLKVDKELERKLNLFPGYQDFESAMLFRTVRGEFFLEITTMQGGLLWRQREPLTSQGVQELRSRVSQRLKERGVDVGLDQSGRFPLLLGTFFLAYGYYGTSIPLILEIDDFAVSTGIYLITGGVGFFGPFFATMNMAVSEGEAYLALSGGYNGIYHGMALYGLVAGDELFASAASLRWFLLTSVGVSVVEYLGGFYAANLFALSGGESLLLGFTTGLGSLWGGLVFPLIHDIAKQPEIRLFWGESLLGSGLGLGLGIYLINSTNYTLGDVNILYQFVTEGALAGFALATFLIYDSQDALYITKTISGLLLGGTVVGLGLGHFLMQDKDFEAFDSSMVALGSYGGGLIGLGIGFILESGAEAPDLRLMAGSAFLGSAAGLGITYLLFQDEAKIREADKSSLTFQFHPEALLLGDWLGREHSMAALPLLEVSFRW